MNPLLKSIDLSHVDVYGNHPSPTWQYRSAVEYLASQGFPVQTYDYYFQDWVLSPKPKWNWDDATYRIDPGSKPKNMRPWNCASDVPPGCFIRGNDWEDGLWSQVVATGKTRLVIVAGGTPADESSRLFQVFYHHLYIYQYSMDGKT